MRASLRRSSFYCRSSNLSPQVPTLVRSPPRVANIHSIVGFTSEIIKKRIERTDSSGLDHVADGESLDSLVLGDAASAVGAAHGLDVAAAVLVAAAVKKKKLKSVFQAQKNFFFWMIPFCHYHGGWEIVDIDIEAPTSFPRRQ